MSTQRRKREESGKYLDFIRRLPCVLCGDNTSVEAAHIRFSDARADKRQTGMGEKPNDVWTLPLCGRHHRDQHQMGERYFWEGRSINPIFLALALYRVAGDHEAAERIISAHWETANG
jgi:hypothetical protein